MGLYLPNSTDSPEDMLYKHCIDQFDIDHFDHVDRCGRSGRSDTDPGCSDSGQDCRLHVAPPEEGSSRRCAAEMVIRSNRATAGSAHNGTEE